MFLIDLTHTSHTPARTGIQRVARSLHQHLGTHALPVTRDPYLRAWRALENWELANLARSHGGKKRKASWPARAKWRGEVRRLLGRTAAHALAGEFDALIEPELFGAAVARDLPRLFQHVRGPRVALFLDAIPLRFPEFTPPATVARFPAYLQELLAFDGIAAISEDSRQSLTDYWRWLGISNPPPVLALPLGVDLGNIRRPPTTATSSVPVVLCVGTLEGRKNHLALLDACEQLWSKGALFQLRIIGHVNVETGGAALNRLRSLQSAGRPLRYDGPASDEAIDSAYAECAFTVYPSIAEGFGLPVIESLARGKPCICSSQGALGEISQQGGCASLPSVAAPALASAIADLLDQPARLAELTRAASTRKFKSWADYTGELTTWIRSLPRHAR